MTVNTRVIRRRIKSVTNTKKITKAMEMVAASKMRKAVNSVLSTRPYATLAWEMIGEISRLTDVNTHPLLSLPFEALPRSSEASREGEAKEGRNRILLILITSDRGLCGGFNAQMLKKTFEFIKTPPFLPFERGSNLPVKDSKVGLEIDVITIGKKGGDAIRRVKKNVIASFADLTNNPRAKDVLPVARLAMDEFVAGKYGSVFLAYTDYVSAIKQIPRVRQLLPITDISSPSEGEAGRGPTDETSPRPSF